VVGTGDGAVAAELPAPAVRRRAVTALLLTGLVVVIADLITKVLAIAHLSGRDPVRLLGGLVYLTFTRNAGAAFSFGSGYTWVFPIIAIVVLSVIFWQARKLGSVPWGVALGLIAGGALGNFGDRLFRAPGPFRGHVVDFISLFDAQGRIFAIFNTADMALTFGVVLAIMLELTGRQRDGTRYRREPRATADAAEDDQRRD
jgi:signal peptidase II